MLTLRVGRLMNRAVRDWAEASRLVRRLLGEYGGAASATFPAAELWRGGRVVAHVSPNGRVWPGPARSSGLSDRPLYDPWGRPDGK